MQKNDPSKAPAQGVKSAPLGIYAKTEAVPADRVGIQWLRNPETGEAVPLENRGGKLYQYRDSRAARAERFALKAAVSELLPGSRTSKCHRWRVPNQALEVRKSVEHGKAFYAGCQVCARVWTCPVCAAKISERRKVELADAITRAERLGLVAYLVTLTVPHGLGDDIHAMLDWMMTAWRKMTTNRAGKAAMNAIGRRGFVRALEVTDGPNGFHPHFHVLMFLDTLMSPDQVQAILSPTWQTACERAGLPRPHDVHGCKVDNGEKAHQYVTKGVWGLESEMTKGHMKQSRNPDGRTPFDLLRAWFYDSDDYSRRRFLVYAQAFEGRRQLYWSNGLRDMLALVELSDEEIATQKLEPASVVSELTTEQWKAILATGSESAVLDVAERTPEALADVLDGIMGLARRYLNPDPPERGGPAARGGSRSGGAG